VTAGLLRIVGELTIHTAAERKAALLSLLEAVTTAEEPVELPAGLPVVGSGDLELDLSEVTELDTAGLQLLLMAHREAAALGRRLVLTRPSPAVVDVLDIVQLTDRLTDRPGPPGPDDAAQEIWR
jgi:anti-anti-sigma regulatory factor